MLRSPSFFKSNTARMERPMRRCISWVRPLCLPLAASLSLRVCVARGNMPYSAVTHPSPEPRLCGGTFSSTEAVHNTLVLPNSINTDPSACMVKLRVIRTERNASVARCWRDAMVVIGVMRRIEENCHCRSGNESAPEIM